MKSDHCRPVYRPAISVATEPTRTTAMTAARNAQRNASTNEKRLTTHRPPAPGRRDKKRPGDEPKTHQASDSSPGPPQRATAAIELLGLRGRKHLLRVLPRLPGRGIRADHLIDGDVRIGAVAVRVAGQGARKALEPLGRKQRIAQRLPPDVQRAAIRFRDLLDGGEGDHRRVVGMRVEARGGLLAKLLLVLGQELLSIPRA